MAQAAEWLRRSSNGRAGSRAAEADSADDTNDCRYDLRTAHEMRLLIAGGAGASWDQQPPRIINYDLSAPAWSDRFDMSRTEKQLPLERPGGPSANVCAAFCARSLKARIMHARAALRSEGPKCTDALVMLAESLPAHLRELRGQALKFAADTAIANVKKAFAETDPVVQSRLAKATARALMAYLRAVEREQPGTAELERTWAYLEPSDRTGGSLLHLHGLWASAWGSVEGPKCQGARQQLLPAIQAVMAKEQHGVQALMVMHYSLFFAAFVAKDGTGCGPDGALVTSALAAIKDSDPEAWVPRLLAGLEMADPTLGPAVVVGSKQEAMACCTFLGKYWMRACGGRTVDHRVIVWAPALARLLAERGLQAPLLGGVHELLRTASVTFNIDRGFHERYSWHMVQTEVEAALKRHARPSTAGTAAMRLDNSLRGAWSLAILLSALAHATHNLPPLRHWVHWEHAEAAWDFCKKAKNSARDKQAMADMLTKHALEVYPAALKQLEQVEAAMAKTDTRWHQVTVIKALLGQLEPSTQRWMWQAGKPREALNRLLAGPGSDAGAFSVELGAGRPGAGSGRATMMEMIEMSLQLQQFLKDEADELSALGRDAALTLTGDSDPCDVSRELSIVLQCGASGVPNGSAAGGSRMAGPGASSAAASTSAAGNGAAAAAAVTAAGSDAGASSSGQSGVGDAGSKPRKGPKKPKGPCAQCGVQLTKTRRCGGCGEVIYCSKECQTLHWQQQHKLDCSRALLKDATNGNANGNANEDAGSR